VKTCTHKSGSAHLALAWPPARQREAPRPRKNAMNTEDKPDTDHNDDIIRNDDTRSRRAWVNRAIEGVRRRLERGEGIPAEGPATGEPDRLPLSVVPSDRKR
jgi:hypothetical protein